MYTDFPAGRRRRYIILDLTKSWSVFCFLSYFVTVLHQRLRQFSRALVPHMSAFGDYKLPKKGKKKKGRHSLVTTSATTSPAHTSSTTTAKTTPSSKTKRVPHPPRSGDELEDSFEFKLTPGHSSTSNATTTEADQRRQRVLLAMLNEIGDEVVSPKANNYGRSHNILNNFSATSNGHHTTTQPTTASPNLRNDTFASPLARTNTEEFGTRFRASSAGRVTSDSPLSTRSEQSEMSTTSTKSTKSTTSSLLGRLGFKPSKKKRKKKRTNKKENGMDETESDTSTASDTSDDEEHNAQRNGGRLTSSQRAVSRLQMEDLDRTRKWLNTPCRKGTKNIQCYITRQKPGRLSRKNPMYRVFMEETDEFVMAGRKRINKRTSNYLITMNREKVERSSHMVVGKVRSNASGSIYHVYDHGLDSKNAVTDSSLRSELALVLFEYDSMGPGKMNVSIGEKIDTIDKQNEPANDV